VWVDTIQPQSTEQETDGVVIRAKSKSSAALSQKSAPKANQGSKKGDPRTTKTNHRSRSEELKERLKKLMDEDKKSDNSGKSKGKKQGKTGQNRVKQLERKLRENLKEAQETERQARTESDHKTEIAEQEKSEAEISKSRADLQASYSDSQLAQAKAKVEQLRTGAEHASTQEAAAKLSQAETVLAQANVAHAESVTEKLKAGMMLEGAKAQGAEARGEASKADHARSKLAQARSKVETTRKSPSTAMQLSRKTTQRNAQFQAMNSDWMRGILKGPEPRLMPPNGPRTPASFGPPVGTPQRAGTPQRLTVGTHPTKPDSKEPVRPEPVHAQAYMHLARKLRQQGKIEEAEKAEEKARAAVFRAQQNTVTAEGAVQKRENALITGPGDDPNDPRARAQKQRVMDQFKSLSSGTSPLFEIGEEAPALEQEARRSYHHPPLRWQDPRLLAARDKKH